MLEGATFAVTFLAYALLHAADARRRPGWLERLSRTSRAALRLAAIGCLGIGIGQWTQTEALSAAFLVVLSMFSAAATLFVLAVPVFPRLVWGLALGCAPAWLLLSVVGGSGG